MENHELKYGAMTVNERLFVAGLMDEFDKAVREKDVTKVVDILKRVELNEKNIKAILEFENLPVSI